MFAQSLDSSGAAILCGSGPGALKFSHQAAIGNNQPSPIPYPAEGCSGTEIAYAALCPGKEATECTSQTQGTFIPLQIQAAPCNESSTGRRIGYSGGLCWHSPSHSETLPYYTLSPLPFLYILIPNFPLYKDLKLLQWLQVSNVCYATWLCAAAVCLWQCTCISCQRRLA